MPTITPRPDALDCYHGTDLTDSFVHALAAAGVRLFIHKASQGTSMRDPLFAARMARVATYNASGEGTIARAAYHGLNGADPVAQIANFLGALAGVGPVIPVLDVERLGTDSAPTASVLKAAIAEFWARTGHHPVLYGSDVLWQLLGQLDPEDYAGCLIWAADYSGQPDHEFVLWQYSQYGTLDGVGLEAGTLDLNVFAGPGSLQDMEAYQVDIPEAA